MANNTAIVNTIRQMMNDWNNATEEQRQAALAAVKRMADEAEQRFLKEGRF